MTKAVVEVGNGCCVKRSLKSPRLRKHGDKSLPTAIGVIFSFAQIWPCLFPSPPLLPTPTGQLLPSGSLVCSHPSAAPLIFCFHRNALAVEVISHI
ncbi:hypothetical protein ACTXT7_009006 [Hymenolepis weldensis]